MSAVALLRRIRRASCGRRSGGSYETGFWLIPSAAAQNPERDTPTHSTRQTRFTPLPPSRQYALGPRGSSRDKRRLLGIGVRLFEG